MHTGKGEGQNRWVGIRKGGFGDNQVYPPGLITVSRGAEDTGHLGGVEHVLNVGGYALADCWEGGLEVGIEGRVVGYSRTCEDQTFVGVVAEHEFEVLVVGALEEEFARYGWCEEPVHHRAICEFPIG